MTDQERIIQQRMEILRLEDQNLMLKRALRETINTRRKLRSRFHA